MEQCRRAAAVQKVYTELFHIYQEQQKLGEQYELVLCLGLLIWKTEKEHTVRRHLVVAKAAIEFDAASETFTVRQAPDGDQAEIELDMLDLEEQPKNACELMRDRIKSVEGDLWNREKLDAALTSIVHALAGGGQGAYCPDRLAPEQHFGTRAPVIEYAPALILRKRSMRGLERLLASIREQIATDQAAERRAEAIPNEFLGLCEILPEEEEHTRIPERIPNEIFFPLPSNEEQRRIISSLKHQKGVIVQGPPGTGKSHTIANLICHLLADGGRVLVTAKTAGALQILHDKLPEDIRPLCINLLGRGSEEQRSLEKSIVGILSADNMQHKIENKKHILELEDRLEKKREEKAATDREILLLREQETRRHTVGCGEYTGTAARIAEQLRRDAPTFSWFTDTISHDTPFPCSPQQITLLREYLLETDRKTEKFLTEKHLPELEKKFPVHKVQEAFEKKNQTHPKQ
ncbi:MAG: DNA helicase, partial [Candidatus Electrothrix sp. AR4]|nr:DNA helicase [Candidatus Electrothrix sp. AR4]